MSPNEELQKDLTVLWNCLHRAGDHWAQDIVLNTTDDGFEAIFYLTSELPRGAGRNVMWLIRHFLKELGWKASVRIFPHYVRMELSKA